ncbi:MAG: helicase, partial [Acetobacteraceae bacterium]
ANRGINTLTIQNIARSSADQRAGRAGRTAAGECWRLWSENDHGRRPAAEVPEILRLDLAEVVLTLHAAGVRDLAGFRWFEAPDPKSLDRANVLLEQLGALRPENSAAGSGSNSSSVSASGGQSLILTGEGRRLTRYPLHPRQARLMEASAEYGCIPAMALITALQQGRPLFVKGAGEPWRKFSTPDDDSDFLPLLRGWQAAAERNFHPDACGQMSLNGRAASEAGRLAAQLTGIAGARRDTPLEIPDAESLAKCLLSGYSDQVARRTSAGSGACDVVGGRRGAASKESVVRGSMLLVAAEIAEVQGRDLNVNLNLLTEITEDWLGDLFPEDFHLERAPFFDAQQRRVSQRERVRFRDLILRDRQSGEAEPHAAAAILADEVLRSNLTLNEWNDATRQWLARLDFLRRAMPDLEVPEFTPEDHRLVLESLFDGCRTYK